MGKYTKVPPSAGLEAGSELQVRRVIFTSNRIYRAISVTLMVLPEYDDGAKSLCVPHMS